MDEQDLALVALKRQCEGNSSRIESSTGPIVFVSEVFRNSDRGDHIDAKIVKPDGAEEIVPMTQLFTI